jgi:hypothetical protein
MEQDYRRRTRRLKQAERKHHPAQEPYHQMATCRMHHDQMDISVGEWPQPSLLAASLFSAGVDGVSVAWALRDHFKDHPIQERRGIA